MIQDTCGTPWRVGFACALAILGSGCGGTGADAPAESGPRAAPTDPAALDAHRRFSAARDRAIDWLVAQQHTEAGDDQGAWGQQAPMVGFSALALTAIGNCGAASRHPQAVADGVGYLLRNRHPNGAIYNVEMGNANYMTSCAILALVTVDPQAHAEAIRAAARAVASGQVLDASDWKNYGGFGYEPGADGRPDHATDLGNSVFALEALDAAADAGVYEHERERLRAAQAFLSRVQNRAESNPLPTEVRGVGNDGGFMYRVGESKAETQIDAQGNRILPSYGSMTYEGLLSFVYAGVDPDDPRVQAARGWIRRNYTVHENPGLSDQHNRELGMQGLFYYLHAFAKAHRAYGDVFIETPDGRRHDWAVEIGDALLAVQSPDGFWMNRNDRWMESDATYATSLALLALQNAIGSLSDRIAEGAVR